MCVEEWAVWILPHIFFMMVFRYFSYLTLNSFTENCGLFPEYSIMPVGKKYLAVSLTAASLAQMQKIALIWKTWGTETKCRIGNQLYHDLHLQLFSLIYGSASNSLRRSKLISHIYFKGQIVVKGKYRWLFEDAWFVKILTLCRWCNVWPETGQWCCLVLKVAYYHPCTGFESCSDPSGLQTSHWCLQSHTGQPCQSLELEIKMRSQKTGWNAPWLYCRSRVPVCSWLEEYGRGSHQLWH